MLSTERAWRPEPGEILTVSSLLDFVKNLLEPVLQDIWLEGEITDLRVAASGHSYFTIVDPRCRMKAVCFRPVSRLLGAALKEADTMLFRGRVTVYEQRGDLQFIVEHAEPRGEGLLRLKLEALKKKLAAEGLFSPERKRPLPAVPRGVAIVTSPTGAALADMLQILRRRAPWVKVFLCPALVQGEGAPGELRRALALASEVEEADTVIIGRGGGASDDLSAFNDEALVRAVAGCPKPVISAVGHEIDFTLTDFAADQRAPTPSAAAELAVRETRQLGRELRRSEERLEELAGRVLVGLRARLGSLDPARYDPVRRLGEKRLHVDRLLETATASLDRTAYRKAGLLRQASSRLAEADPAALVARALGRVASLDAALDMAAERELASAKGRLTLALAALESMNPKAVLARGYSIVRSGGGTLVRRYDEVAPGETLRVTLGTGHLTGTVTGSGSDG